VSAKSFVTNHPEFGLTAKQLTTLAIYDDVPCQWIERGLRYYRVYNFTEVRDGLLSRRHRKRRRSTSAHSHLCTKCGHLERCGTRQRRVAKVAATFIVKAQWPEGDLSRPAVVKVREIRKNA
jgi:hypothetical protein